MTVIDEYISSEIYDKFLIDSKYCILPYRGVNQSGPLNDALKSQNGIICSDLDYFKSCDADDSTELIEKLNFNIWTPTLTSPISTWGKLTDNLRN